mgnify:CR=1 FL=1
MEQKNNTDEVRIEQISPRTELNDLEKTAILQFKIEKKIQEQREEELSKTAQFKFLNNRFKSNNIDLPKKKSKKDNIELPTLKPSLTDTIRIKISDLRDEVEKSTKVKKKSLYDTVIIKLDDLINNKKSLKIKSSNKVLSVEKPLKHKRRFHLFKVKDISKSKHIKLNVDDEEFERQLYNLNKLALNNLTKVNHVKTRRYSPAVKLNHIEKIHISKLNYLKYQQKMTKFAVDRLYYKLAPKETKKYKIYKYSVMLSGFIFVVTGLAIVNWFFQGLQANNLSNAIIEDTPIVQIEDTTTSEVIDAPPPEKKEEYSNKNTLYWKYLNTPLSSVDFSDLTKQNKDTVAWIIVKNTNVNYPVVQTSDNDYYLKHSFNRKSNSAGWVFADYRDNLKDFNQNMIIYAHGRKDKVMFGSLTNTLKKNWYTNQDNQIIQLSTPDYNTMWQIFSIYKVEAESYYITTDFYSDESYQKFIDTMKSRSIYDFGVDVTTKDKLLTLSTCYNDKGIRLVVQAKLVKIQER